MEELTGPILVLQLGLALEEGRQLELGLAVESQRAAGGAGLQGFEELQVAIFVMA